jgi:hypothetical protein
MDSTDIYRILHSTNTEYRVLSEAHGTFFKIDPFLDHKTSVSKKKKEFLCLVRR